MKDEMSGFSLLNAESGKEAKLAMEGLWLTGRVLPVGARLLVAHTFRSGEAKPVGGRVRVRIAAPIEEA